MTENVLRAFCPVCNYRFTIVVKSRKVRPSGRAGDSLLVWSELADYRGARALEECPGCGRESTVLNVVRPPCKCTVARENGR